jgi:hypothetical protein
VRVLRDIILLVASIVLALVLARTGVLDALLERTTHIRYLDAFVAGAFFTSIFTVAPATVALARLARGGEPLWELAFIGALGAMVADAVILTIIKDTITDNILAAVRHSRSNRLKYFFRRGKTRLAGTLLGAVVIASPLPDEMGLFLMGLARARRWVTLVLTYVLNAAGIAAVALAAMAF